MLCRVIFYRLFEGACCLSLQSGEEVELRHHRYLCNNEVE